MADDEPTVTDEMVDAAMAELGASDLDGRALIRAMIIRAVSVAPVAMGETK